MVNAYDQAQDKQWGIDETEKLIRLWQENPALYDMNHPLYTDKNHKSLLYTQIADELKTTESEIVKKMKGLRTYYLTIKPKSKSGDAAVKKPKWHFFEQLKFLEQGVPIVTCTDSSSPDFLASSPADYRRQETKKRRRKSDEQTPITPLVERAVRAIERDVEERDLAPRDFPGKAEPKKSEDELFGDIVSMQLSKVPDGNEKDDAKMEIQGILHRLKKDIRAKATAL